MTKPNGHHAARLVQSVWRRRLLKQTTLRLLKQFLDSGIETMAHKTANNTRAGYEELFVFLRKEHVINSARALLERICFLSTSVHGASVVPLESTYGTFRRNNARVFLTAYIIHLHFNQTILNMDAVALTAIKSARAVLNAFTELSGALQQTKSFFKVPCDLCRGFNACLAQFIRDFRSWELSDDTPHWSVMRSTLVQLYFGYFCQPSVGQGSEIRVMIAERIKFLRERTRQIHKQATLDQFDAELRVGRFGLPPILTERLEELDADPTFFAVRHVEEVQLVQDLYLDVNHRITEAFLKESPIHVYVSQSHKDSVYWSVVCSELLSFPVVFKAVYSTLSEYKQRILDIVSEGRKCWVDECVRIEHRGWNGCVETVRSIVDVLLRVQMPVRDKETGDGWQAFEATSIDTPEIMIEALKFVNDRLRVAECDAHSFRILLQSRHLHENGHLFIAKRFREMLSNGVITMERTKAWIASSVQEYMGVDVRIRAEMPVRFNDMTIRKVLFFGLRRLLFSERLVSHEQDFPETYLLDVWRLCSLQRKMRIDAAAFCAVGSLWRFLSILKLAGTHNGKLAIQRVVQLFLSIDYGTRGLDDHVDAFTLPSFTDRIKEELKTLFPEHAHCIAEFTTVSSINPCLGFDSTKFWQIMKRLEAALNTYILFGGVPFEGAHLRPYIETDCAAVMSRVTGNFQLIRRLFRANTSVHWSSRLKPFVEAEFAKLKHSQ